MNNNVRQNLPERKKFAYNMHGLSNNIFNQGTYGQVPYGHRKTLHVRIGTRQENMINDILRRNKDIGKEEEQVNKVILPKITTNSGTNLNTNLLERLDKSKSTDKKPKLQLSKNNIKLESITNEAENSNFDKNLTIDYDNYITNNKEIEHKVHKEIKSLPSANKYLHLPPKIPNYKQIDDNPNNTNSHNYKNEHLDTSNKRNSKRYNSADDMKNRGNKINNSNLNQYYQSNNSLKSNINHLQEDNLNLIDDHCKNNNKLEMFNFKDHDNFNKKMINTLEMQRNRIERFKDAVLKKNIEKEHEIYDFIDKQINKQNERDNYEFYNNWNHRKDKEKIYRDQLKLQMNEKQLKREELKIRKKVSMDKMSLSLDNEDNYIKQMKDSEKLIKQKYREFLNSQVIDNLDQNLNNRFSDQSNRKHKIKIQMYNDLKNMNNF